MAVVYNGDMREVLKNLRGFHACVTDPPYGLQFLSKAWDRQVPGPEYWQRVYDSLLPGGHLLAFCGTRTYHRLVVAVEDAGFEIRDTIMWMYGSGFPKSLDVSKAIDKAAGAEREVLQERTFVAGGGNAWRTGERREQASHITAPATDAAKQWEGWGTALKPAYEPIVLARKPLKQSVIANVQEHGTGAINIAASRIGTHGGTKRANTYVRESSPLDDDLGAWPKGQIFSTGGGVDSIDAGRWPPNVILGCACESDEEHDPECAVRLLDEHAGYSQSRKDDWTSNGWSGQYAGGYVPNEDMRPKRSYDDEGGMSRFFYTAKASRKDRQVWNRHPTVKPLDLMAYLVRMVTPPDGVVLDPFCGSGSTLVAARQLNIRAVGIEMDEESAEVTANRLGRTRFGNI